MQRKEIPAFDDDSVCENHGAEDDATLTPALRLNVDQAMNDFGQAVMGLFSGKGFPPSLLDPSSGFCFVKAPQPGLVATNGACFGGGAFRRKIAPKYVLEGFVYLSVFKDGGAVSQRGGCRTICSWRRSAEADKGVQPFPFRLPAQ